MTLTRLNKRTSTEKTAYSDILKLKALTVIMLITIVNLAYSQIKDNPAFNQLMQFRGLAIDDITIPLSLDKEKSPRNDSKLILPLTKSLMEKPLEFDGFMDSLNSLSGKSLSDVIMGLVNYLEYDGIKIKDNFTGKFNLNSVLKFLKKSVPEINKNYGEITKIYTGAEKIFLLENLFSIINESEDYFNVNDIFQFNKLRDSNIATSEKTMELLSRADRKKVTEISVNAFFLCLDIYSELIKNPEIFKTMKTDYLNNNFVSGDFFYYLDSDGIRIAIGSRGKNVYSGKIDFIIDAGGDDVYRLDSDEKEFSRFNCIIDLEGNDIYTSKSNMCNAAAFFNSSFIFDKEGDDYYSGKILSLGASVCGMGILHDESGNDTYRAEKFSQGASSFGAGLLYDNEGNDIYSAVAYSQGFGMTMGVGTIADNSGNDSYISDARSLDIGRYEDHYITMSQGFGLGLRPFYAGGIGIILENSGNDFYSTDIYGQGAAYWYAVGCIADKKGNDKYNSYQYSQGAGIHLAVGLLKDYDGWDFYTSNGVSQGCGHDFGVGILHDLKGNDNYSAYSLSQGAGNANGIGILLDESGKDGYLNKEPNNTRGYGNPRRDFGSIGLFIDESGTDFYSEPDLDSVVSNSSNWGGMIDFYLTDETSIPVGEDFKIPLDSSKDYSPEEYFIMAKTIEPRFSLWQEFGFRKLVEDSTSTSGYILEFLDTEDHREALVVRNLAFKIGHSMGNVFKEKLNNYLTSMQPGEVLNENQISYMCYLMGETGNSTGKEELLSLTHNVNIRIQTSAVNALGKIRLKEEDLFFKEKVSDRLTELAYSGNDNKMLNKDISFAFKNYLLKTNIPVLIDLLGRNYFGVRFNASECLKKYGDDYFHYIDNSLLIKMNDNPSYQTAFLFSITDLSENNFKSVIEKVCTFYPDFKFGEKSGLNLIEVLEFKMKNSEDEVFKNWCREIIQGFGNEKLKIKK